MLKSTTTEKRTATQTSYHVCWHNMHGTTTESYKIFLFHLLDNMSRARLRPTAEEGSEYINASFVDVGLNSHCYLQFIFS